MTCFDFAGNEQWERRIQEDYGQFGLNWGYGSSPLLALKAGGKGDIGSSHVVWKSENGPDVPTPISDGKYLWMVTGDRSLFSCLDLKTGQPLYDRERLPSATYSASPVLADGRIYLMNESCETVVLEAGPEFKILAVNKLEGSNGLSSPAVAGGELFLRTSEAIYCLTKLE